jgi:DNA-binding NarL/FixJ family response regulator
VYRLRVLIAVTHEPLRGKIVTLLNSEFQVIGAVTDGEELVEAAFLFQPDVIVSDIDMPVMGGFDAREELLARNIQYPFVFITLLRIAIASTVENGPIGYVHKIDLGEELKLAVNSVARGRFYASRSFRD